MWAVKVATKILMTVLQSGLEWVERCLGLRGLKTEHLHDSDGGVFQGEGVWGSVLRKRY